jgi:tetratricopeptide (TPR) repeat protein
VLASPRSRWSALGVVVVIVAVATLLRFRPAQALTEKDAVLIADFVNTTGEPVFDGTLKQALAVQLEQSPFLNVVPQDRVRQTLTYMGRSPEERVTASIGREICEREGIKAMLSGSIASLGSQYVLTLEAVNAKSGASLAREQTQAESKEKVLQALGGASSSLRARLGESLASIKAYDTPVEKATTSSLEALKAFSTAETLRGTKGEVEAIPFLQKAIELDPNFAMAQAKLGTLYLNLGESERSIEYTTRAFGLRDRVSEREKLYISMRYYGYVTGEFQKHKEAVELWRRTYPRDSVALEYLSLTKQVTGDYQRALDDAREELSLDPQRGYAYNTLATTYLALNQIEEAKLVLAQAAAQKVEQSTLHWLRYAIAFQEGDTAMMEKEAQWFKGQPDEYFMEQTQARAAAFGGRLGRARELFAQATSSAVRGGLDEAAAFITLDEAFTEAVCGNSQRARERASAGLARGHGSFIPLEAARAFAFSGAADKAQPLLDETGRRFPSYTLIQDVDLTAQRALLEIGRGNAAKAIELLRAAAPYELGNSSPYTALYVRGLAHLRLRQGAEAAQQFQRVLDRRGLAPLSPLYPLSQLGLARAAALSGDTAKARRAYQDFLALWKDADADVPVLQEAKKEYASLKAS